MSLKPSTCRPTTATCCKCSNTRLRAVTLVVVGFSIICLIAVGSMVEFGGYRLGVSKFIHGFSHLGASNLTRSLSRSFSKPPRKMLIYLCLKEHGCAGWSDRQRAMVSTYLLSLVTDRQFGVLLQSPCDVRNFYMPNKYDWTVNEKDLEGREQGTISLADNFTSIDFNQKYPEDVLFARGNADNFYKITSNPHFRPLLPSWAKKRYKEYFHNGWNILMKPTPKIQQRLHRFLDSLGYYNKTKPLVGVHIRLGKNPSNPYDGRVFMNASCLNPLWHRVEKYVKNGSQLFVASDSEQVRNMSRRRFGSAHHDTAGIILHVGKQKNDVRACQGFEDAVFDQLILSYCEVLFITQGGFGFRASMMGGRMKKLHRFNHVTGKVSG